MNAEVAMVKLKQKPQGIIHLLLFGSHTAMCGKLHDDDMLFGSFADVTCEGCQTAEHRQRVRRHTHYVNGGEHLQGLTFETLCGYQFGTSDADVPSEQARGTSDTVTCASCHSWRVRDPKLKTMDDVTPVMDACAPQTPGKRTFKKLR